VLNFPNKIQIKTIKYLSGEDYEGNLRLMSKHHPGKRFSGLKDSTGFAKSVQLITILKSKKERAIP